MRILSVCLSVTRVDCDKTEDRSVQIFIPYEKSFKFSEKKNGWWGRPLLPQIVGQPCSRWSEIADFQPIFARSASAVTTSEKKFN